MAMELTIRSLHVIMIGQWPFLDICFERWLSLDGNQNGEELDCLFFVRIVVFDLCPG